MKEQVDYEKYVVRMNEQEEPQSDATPTEAKDAEESGFVLLATKKRMYEACGILYSNGLVGNKVQEGRS